MQELHRAAKMPANVVQVPAREVVGDAHSRPTRQKLIRERRPNKRGASCDQYEFPTPKTLRRFHARRASSIIRTTLRNSPTLSESFAAARAASPIRRSVSGLAEIW